MKRQNLSKEKSQWQINEYQIFIKGPVLCDHPVSDNLRMHGYFFIFTNKGFFLSPLYSALHVELKNKGQYPLRQRLTGR